MNPIIIETIKYFDFEKVRVAIEALDIRWSTADGMQVPTIGMIMTKAVELLEQLLEERENYKDITAISTCGLKAEYYSNGEEEEYHLSFCLEDSTCFVDKKGKIL